MIPVSGGMTARQVQLITDFRPEIIMVTPSSMLTILSALRPGTARPAFRRMDKVTGRSDDMIIMRGVNVFPTQIEEVVLVTDGLAPHFQLKLTKSDRMDQMTVLVEARLDTPADRRESAAVEIAARVKDGVGISVAVEVCDPGTLERSVGKMRRVIDQRHP